LTVSATSFTKCHYLLSARSPARAEWDGNELLFGFSVLHLAAEHLPFAVVSRCRPVVVDEPALWARIEADIPFNRFTVEQVTYPSKTARRSHVPRAQERRAGRREQPDAFYGYGGFNISLTPAFAASRFPVSGARRSAGRRQLAAAASTANRAPGWDAANKQNVSTISSPRPSGCRSTLDEPEAAGHPGRIQWRAAGRRCPDAAAGAVPGGRLHVPLLDMLRYHAFLLARSGSRVRQADDSSSSAGFTATRVSSCPRRRRLPVRAAGDGGVGHRVDALHARKMAARLQAASFSDNPILLRLETKAGHGAGKPRAKVLEELTDVWSFLFAQLGIDA